MKVEVPLNPAHEPLTPQEYASLEALVNSAVARLLGSGGDARMIAYYYALAAKLVHQWHVAVHAQRTPSSSETDS